MVSSARRTSNVSGSDVVEALEPLVGTNTGAGLEKNDGRAIEVGRALDGEVVAGSLFRAEGEGRFADGVRAARVAVPRFVLADIAPRTSPFFGPLASCRLELIRNVAAPAVLGFFGVQDLLGPVAAIQCDDLLRGRRTLRHPAGVHAGPCRMSAGLPGFELGIRGDALADLGDQLGHIGDLSQCLSHSGPKRRAGGADEGEGERSHPKESSLNRLFPAFGHVFRL